MQKFQSISIHALREEGDHIIQHSAKRAGEFLSTPSARRATLVLPPAAIGVVYFYPRPPREGRPLKLWSDEAAELFLSTPSARRATDGGHVDVGRAVISIHALREEGDFVKSGYDLKVIEISIHALREEGDLLYSTLSIVSPISIHALREEGDRFTRRWTSISTNFYPRPPRGGRRYRNQLWKMMNLFLSTPSARRATMRLLVSFFGARNFYPRPPRGGRPTAGSSTGKQSKISIHALREEGDPLYVSCNSYDSVFLSTPSARRATT